MIKKELGIKVTQSTIRKMFSSEARLVLTKDQREIYSKSLLHSIDVDDAYYAFLSHEENVC